MFDEWMNQWREAVDNFDRELHADEGGDHARGMRRQITSARGALTRLETEIERASSEAAAERDAEQVCIRRQSMALAIEDEETARIAGEYADRHAERAALYDRKTEVLRDERAMMTRDLDVMENEFTAHVTDANLSDDDEGVAPGRKSVLDEVDAAEQSRQDLELARLRRERLANEKLEELKRRMRG